MKVLIKCLFYIGQKLGHIVQVKNSGNTTNIDNSKVFFPLYYHVIATLLHSSSFETAWKLRKQGVRAGLN